MIFNQIIGNVSGLKKYNSTIDYVLGDVDGDGLLNKPTYMTNFIFDGIETMVADALNKKFKSMPNVLAANFPDLLSVTNTNSLFQTFYECTNLQTFLAPLLTTISSSCEGLCYGCTNLTTVNLNSLTTVSSNAALRGMFQGCTSLEQLALPNLTTIPNGNQVLHSLCRECTSLLSLKLPSLTSDYGTGVQTFGYLCYKCSALTSIKFESLNQITSGQAFNYAFSYCNALTDIYFYALDQNSFGSLTNQFGTLLTNSGTAICTIHFPKKLDPAGGSTVISGLTGYPNFGKTAGYLNLSYEIITELTDSNNIVYTRSEKDSTSTAIAWKNNGTLYYTDATAEPIVNDIIYSDVDLTTSVSTINAIA